VRYFLSRREAPLTRVLLIESGSRSLLEALTPHLRETWARELPIDLLTCYNGLPSGFGPETTVYRVTDYPTPQSRKELIRHLRALRYTTLGIVCSGEAIMTKWKWMIALRLPAKVFIINENADYFWMNRAQSDAIRQFSLVRLGLAGEGALRTVGRLLVFPFTLSFLLLYAFIAHSGRIVRQIFLPSKP
jgi:hypothetical protein